MKVVFLGSSADQPTPDFMVPELGPEELRVLGCLIEKQFFTPDVYPMTLNSILTACNQKTSREPVVQYDDATVDAVLTMLQGRGLAARITGADHRVPKWKELLGEKTGLRVSEISVLCVMMLRGPQTLAELKERTNRIHEFADLSDVENTVDRLMHREPQSLVVRLAKMPGQKEVRYMHMMGGAVEMEAWQTAHAATAVTAAPALQSAPVRDDRVTRLETEVAALKEQVARLEQQLAEFRKQFE